MSLLIPFAHQYKNKMRERGNYPGGGGPRGCVVHFTAGHYEKGDQNAYEMIEEGNKNKFTYLCISTTGKVVQAHDVMKWGYHAGESAWKVKLKHLAWNIVGSVSDDLIGIEVCNAGKLAKVGDEFFPWWAFKKGKLLPKSKSIPEEQVRFVNKEIYGCPTGWYHKYTKQQEEALTKTILWLYVNCDSFKLQNVLGHHEVSGVKGIGYWRKSDPGGALSMSMDNYRNWLIENKSVLIQKYDIQPQVNS